PYSKYLAAGLTWTANFKLNQPDKPWYKEEVRQALTMAIDYEGLKNGYFGGEAIYPAWPSAPYKEFQDFGFYTPLKELPADIQELFSHNVAKAKQMLADAGYPNGFKASVIVQTKDTDMLQLFKAYWADIGVDISIDIKEPAVFAGIQTLHNYSEGIFLASAGSYPTNLMNYLPGDWHNYPDYTGAEMSPMALKMDELWFNAGEMGRVWKEFEPHVFRIANFIASPMGYGYNFWQPWVQNYHGEYTVGNAVTGNFVKYIWVDMDLKAKLMGK
ncbi:MAG: hypothetical protein HYX81_05565, partial [Chloroflexi bacterium]|nr:hypothetical protein [Chloroflexota bacterium]